MSEPLTLESVRKTYRGERVVDIDELRLSPGEVLALTGPNGAGKSTLLRIMGLLEEPDAGFGRFHILGEKPGRPNRTALRRRVAVVFQTPYMFQRSAGENIALPLRWRRLTRPDIDARVFTIADDLGIDYLQEPAGTLSRGQVQRVALARALVSEPDLLLLDEPLSALDVEIKTKLLQTLKGKLTKAGRSAVYVTHDLAEIESIADRHLKMIGGRLEPS